MAEIDLPDSGKSDIKVVQLSEYGRMIKLTVMYPCFFHTVFDTGASYASFSEKVFQVGSEGGAI